MKFTAKEIAEYLNGTVEGNPEEIVSNISKIEEGEKGTLSFLANPKYENYLYSTKASIVLINNNFQLQGKISCTLIRVKNSYESFASLLELYYKKKNDKQGISSNSHINQTAQIGDNVYVGEFSSINKNSKIANNVKIYQQVYIGEGVEISDNTILHPGVKIYDNCKIGKNCVIHAGVVIGSDGFGFAPTNSDYKKIPQIGNVIIEDDVEIGSNTTIDRATLGSTIIRKGVKLDNLIQVAHNVEIGEQTVIAAQSGISGSTQIGKRCMIGGQVAITGHIKIEDEVKIGGKSGVISNIKKGTIVMGNPSFNIMNYKKSSVIFRKLPEIKKQIDIIQKDINKLLDNNK